MIKIVIENENGEKKPFKPLEWVHKKIERYYNNPREFEVDAAIIMGGSLALGEIGYLLNAVTRARRTK